LDEYDENLTTIAYLTSSAEFETHLHLNGSDQKRITVNSDFSSTIFAIEFPNRRNIMKLIGLV
jgi:hypothetical protein